MGVQRLYNNALQPMSRDAFVELVTADQPEAPSYFAYDAMLNRHERATLDEALEQELMPLSLEAVLRLMNTGAQLVDVRDVADFAGAHLQGSLNMSLNGAYATWAGTLLDRKQPIVVVADPGQQGEAAIRCGSAMCPA